MRIKNEYCANRALAESINADAIVQRGPRINRSALRMMRAERRREAAARLVGNVAFIALFAACFFLMFL